MFQILGLGVEDYVMLRCGNCGHVQEERLYEDSIIICEECGLDGEIE